MFWNIILTLVIAPAFWMFRSMMAEVKRIDILLNKTREEIALKYVSKTDAERDMDRLLGRFDKLEEKIDQIING